MTTKTAQFTPGPWNVRHYRVAPTNCQWSDVTDSTGGLITHVPSSKGNAALIAAAPVMYADLCAVRDYLFELYDEGNAKAGEYAASLGITIEQAEGQHHE